MIATLSSGILVHPDPKVRQDYADRVGASDLFYPDDRTGKFSDPLNIDHLILAPEMLKIAESSGQSFHGFPYTAAGTGHWNEDGHAVAAELLAEYLHTTRDISNLIRPTARSETQ